jgi:NAD(P)-dependent dehydrogenase (short-subunit alcohol dehydrogenase family)
MQRTVLVTGATDGIGAAIAHLLASNGARVILHGRSAERLKASAEGIRTKVPGALVGTVCGDFASLAGVEAAASAVTGALTAVGSDKLDAIIHNAAAFFPEHALTVDGIERGWMVNHVAPFLLTHRLMPLLRASKARVIVVSALGHMKASLPDNPNKADGYDGQQRYMATKMANVLFAQTLARLFPEELSANSVHPGVVTTKLLRAAYNMDGRDDVGVAAQVPATLAIGEEALTGRFYVRGKPAAMHTLANDTDVQDALWEQTEELCRL